MRIKELIDRLEQRKQAYVEQSQDIVVRVNEIDRILDIIRDE